MMLKSKDCEFSPHHLGENCAPYILSSFQVANWLWISSSLRERRDGKHKANWFLLT